MNLKKSALCTAITAAMGFGAGSASADLIDFSFDFWLTIVNPDGNDALVNTDASRNPMYGRRTAVTGVMTFDTDAGYGIGDTNAPFSFFGSGNATGTQISFHAIGDGSGGSGNLILGNFGFTWNGDPGIPATFVLDASGFFEAIDNGLSTGSTIGTGCAGCVDGWSEDMAFSFGKASSYTLPMGSVPMATTTWNTTDIGTVTLGSNPSGTLPLIDDGIGGSPMKVGDLAGFNFNLDVTDIAINSYTATVSVPAAVWLFGSGLLGLVGMARRKKASTPSTNEPF